MGGHQISEKVVRRRFYKGIKNLFKLYKPVLDSWTLFDNSGNIPHEIAQEEGGKIEIFDQELYDKILKLTETP
jgi:predicted ABC-type ATPase